MKELYKKARNKLKDRRQPSSRQSLLTPSTQSLYSIHESAPSRSNYYCSSTTLQTSQLEVTATSTATPHSDSPGPVTPINDPSSRFKGTDAYKLCEAMQRKDSNIFAPLHIALVGLIKTGRCGDVCMQWLIKRFRNPHLSNQSQYGASQELAAIETRVPSFEVVARVSRSDIPSEVYQHLHKVLCIIGV